jgi:hypothetical protein
MQEREKEGCWFMTKGHVYNQEPNQVASQICISTVQDYVKTAVSTQTLEVGNLSQNFHEK